MGACCGTNSGKKGNRRVHIIENTKIKNITSKN